MRLSKALEEKKLDLRLRDKLLHEGRLNKSEVGDFLESLPDDTANAAYAKVPIQTFPRHSELIFSRAFNFKKDKKVDSHPPETANGEANSIEPQSE